MTIYVDNLNLRASVKNGARTHTSRWCHLMSDVECRRLGQRYHVRQHPAPEVGR